MMPMKTNQREYPEPDSVESEEPNKRIDSDYIEGICTTGILLGEWGAL